MGRSGFLKWVGLFLGISLAAGGIIFSGITEEGTAIEQVIWYVSIVCISVILIIYKLTYDKRA